MVLPSIPHEIIEAVVKDLGFILTSPISFMKASIPGDEYNHILSFRRQAYIIPPTDSFNLQTSALISHDGLEHQIFLSSDRMECFICKEVGHIAMNCTSMSTNAVNSDQNTVVNSSLNITMAIIPDVHPSGNPAQKRLHSDTLTSHSSSVCDTREEPSVPNTDMPPPSLTQVLDKSTKPMKKRPKTDTASDSPLSSVTKQIIKERYEACPEDFILSIDNFFAFLENTFGVNNPYDIAVEYTKDIKTLLANIHICYTSVPI
ncbi:hypothetical protein ABEB36_013458 [Hypothenemus hampei]|uniref:CCHC-type domain-containing protein n=1 Tax=Hypothenemus hampei TaxID=57062 RepID=A0ABD1E907_HYPHA